jgi:hypothetical protein
MTLNWRAVVPALAALAAACGPETSSQRSLQSVECSLKVPANAVEMTMKQVEDGSLDPCGGALTQSGSYAAELERIEPGNGADPFVIIVYQMRLRHPNDPLPKTP